MRLFPISVRLRGIYRGHCLQRRWLAAGFFIFHVDCFYFLFFCEGVEFTGSCVKGVYLLYVHAAKPWHLLLLQKAVYCFLLF